RPSTPPACDAGVGALRTSLAWSHGRSVGRIDALAPGGWFDRGAGPPWPRVAAAPARDLDADRRPGAGPRDRSLGRVGRRGHARGREPALRPRAGRVCARRGGGP